MNGRKIRDILMDCVKSPITWEYKGNDKDFRCAIRTPWLDDYGQSSRARGHINHKFMEHRRKK